MNEIKYNQASPSPTAKVAAGGIGGSITVVLLYLIKVLFEVDVPAEVGAALATVIAFISAYMTRDRKPIEVVNAIEETKVNN